MVEPIAPTLKANLLALAKEYCALTGVTIRTVSRYTTNDGDTLSRLRTNGASITLRKYDDAVAWFVGNWPKGRKRPRLINPSHRKKRAA